MSTPLSLVTPYSSTSFIVGKTGLRIVFCALGRFQAITSTGASHRFNILGSPTKHNKPLEKFLPAIASRLKELGFAGNGGRCRNEADEKLELYDTFHEGQRCPCSLRAMFDLSSLALQEPPSQLLPEKVVQALTRHLQQQHNTK